jgi:hypothetical protein
MVEPGATGAPGEGGRVPVRKGTSMTRKGESNSGGYLKRDPRIAVRCDAVLIESDGCTLDVVITDVSRDGFKLESRCELEVGAEIMLLVSKLQPVKAMIRWTCGYEAGGVFLEPVAL